jgi:carboxyl-terminal processing protease
MIRIIDLKAAVPFVATALLSACASFDPHNLLGRQNNPYAASGGSEWSYTPSADAARKLREHAVDLVWNTVNDRYYRADLNGVNWRAAREKWAPRAVSAPSDDEFWELLDQMTGELADSHTRVEAPKAVARRRAQLSFSLGLGLRAINGELIVTSVHPESDAYWAGVRAGMRVTHIEGADAMTQWRDWQNAARKTSSPQAEARLPLRKLNASAERGKNSGVALTFERATPTLSERAVASASINTASLIAAERFTATLKPKVLSTRPTISHRVLPSGVGYVRLSAFSEPLRAPLLAAIAELKDTPAMILDLRGNGGGSAAMSEALVGAFFKEKTLIGRTTTRTGQPVTLAFGAIKLSTAERHVSGRADAYTGKLAILMDVNSASASEATAMALQSTGRATVVGETSCGCLLAFMGYATVPGGGELAYSELGFVSVKGEAVEGRGVIPDQTVMPTALDYLLARDRMIELAQSLLTK